MLKWPFVTRPIQYARFLFGTLALGLVIGASRYVNHSYFTFPAFPNILDLAVGAAVGIFLFYEFLAELVKKDEKN